MKIVELKATGTMWRNVLGLVMSAALLAACATDPESGDMSQGTTSSAQEQASAPTVSKPNPGSARDFLVNVGDRVLFAYDSSRLSESALEVLKLQARWLNRHRQTRVRIEGHCDERGTREYNLALGERRANAVRDFLVAQGVNAARLSVISYGKERPDVAGSNAAAWAQNRRAVTAIVGG